MPNAGNVTAAKANVAGAVFSAVFGTSLPVTPNESLASAFKDLGFVSQDGVTNSTNIESTTVKEWGGNTVLTIQTSKDDQFKLKLLETKNVEALKEVFGQNNVSVAGNGLITIVANASEQAYRSYVIDMSLSDGGLKRIVLPKAKVSSIGDITYTASDAANFDLTFDTAPDGSGNTHYEYILPGSGSGSHIEKLITDTFEGDGSETEFTLTETPVSAVTVTVDGAAASGVTVSGTTLTFASAPANDAAITARYTYVE